MQLLMWLPFVFTLSVLTYACVYDLKERQVSNRVWLFAYSIGFIITITEIMLGLLDGAVVLVSFLVWVFLGVVLFWSGFYGGADIKALLFITLTTPTIPYTLNPILNLPPLPLILTVFCNSILLSLIWPLTIFVLNLKDTLKGNNMFEEIQLSLPQKVRLFFTARQTPLEKLNSLRYFPAEQIEIQNGQPTRKPLRVVKAETDLTTYNNDLKTHKHLYKKGVFASPTIPTIVFFTIALAIAPLGNLFFWAITLLGII
ncbi:MAG: prepilin peptidase [Nitrososphaerota archaeon]|nr:prepilin peptidase [Nitrososphaerota archaeon]